MLADNVVYLKKNYPMIYRVQLEFETSISEPIVFLEDTKKSGIKTIKYCNGDQTVYLHSKYDPVKEAETLIDRVSQNEIIDENTHVIFYGIGLGYHIEAFLNRFPKTAFSLYEPSIDVFSQLLKAKNLKKIASKNLRNIVCEYNTETMVNYFSEFISFTDKKTIIVELPVYEKVFSDRHEQFVELLKKHLHQTRSSINVNYGFKRSWIINSVNNFNHVLNTTNILMMNQNIFEGKTAILVAAGPSLDYEIENLRSIKENGLAFIFSVGSAINTLIHNNILPDAVCAYDPTNELYVYQKLNEAEIENCPMIFGSSVGYDVVTSYRGSKFNMITTQDTVSNYFLRTKDDKELIAVHDAPSIAVVTLELLHLLKFSKIILVGQNLALKGEKDYAEGIDYRQGGVSGSKETLVMTKDVNGNDIFTRDSFNRMRTQMEFYIKNYNLSVINTTIDGAHIEGTQFIPLETVIKNSLNCRIVIGDEFEKMDRPCVAYDLNYLEEKLNQLIKEFDQYQKILTNLKKMLNNLKDSVKNNNLEQTRVNHIKVDDYIREMEANDFFRVFDLPLNRVEYEILVNNVQRIKKEKNELVRAKLILKPTENFINLLTLNRDLNQNIMKVLINNITNYINERKA